MLTPEKGIFLKTLSCSLVIAFGLVVNAANTNVVHMEPQQIPGTSLRLSLPPGWTITTHPGAPNPITIEHAGEPLYYLQVSQTRPGNLPVGFPSSANSCSAMIGSLQESRAVRAAKREPRPSIFPTQYFGSVLHVVQPDSMETKQMWVGCLNTGASLIAVTIGLKSKQENPDVLKPLIVSIAEAALSQASPVQAPNKLPLKLLGINVKVPIGKWIVQDSTDMWGHNDLLIRVDSSKELEIMPLLFAQPGRCEDLMRSLPNMKATLVSKPRYVGSRWFPASQEQLPPPGVAVEAFVCHDIPPRRILLARITQEGTVFDDPEVIAAMLDSIAAAEGADTGNRH